MLKKTSLLFCILCIGFGSGLIPDLQSQTLSRVLGGDGLALDSHALPYRAVTLYVPANLLSSYSLAFPSSPPPGPLSLLGSDVNGIMSWIDPIGLLPALPHNNLWVGSALNIATPFPPTVPGAVLTLNGSASPAWSTIIPSVTTISVSQLTTGTLQPGVTFNVGTNSTIISTGGTNTANNLNGAGTGKYAGNAAIPQNAVTLTVSYPAIQSGSAVILNINDPNTPGVAVYLQSITPGVGFTVTFSANYPTTTGVISYIVVNP